MANDNSRPDVAVFIDFENVYVSVRDKLDANPDFEAIMDRCSELGRVVISRAYADWYRYPRVTSALYANGVEPMYVPTYYYDKDMGRTGRAIKNSADMNMCIDAMKTLFTNTNIATFVLVTGDRDFIPLVNMIRQQGKDVVIIGIGGAASSHLAQSADEFIFYEQLVGKTSVPAAREVNRERPRTPERNRPVEVEAEAPTAPTAPPVPPEQQSEPDIFDTLVQAVHLARKRGYVCTLGSLKLVMKELMGGDFKESRYKDLSGRSFAKFKDFVLDAERRGKVQIFTNGTINEVFLPGEDPYKLSQFTGDVKEEAAETQVAPPVATNGRQPSAPAAARNAAPTPPSNGRSRRRRRSRGGRQVEAPGSGMVPLSPEQEEMIDEGEEVEEIEEIEELEGMEEVEDVTEESLTEANELVAALMPSDFFDPEGATEDLLDSELAESQGLLIPDDLIELPIDDVLEEDVEEVTALEMSDFVGSDGVPEEGVTDLIDLDTSRSFEAPEFAGDDGTPEDDFADLNRLEPIESTEMIEVEDEVPDLQPLQEDRGSDHLTSPGGEDVEGELQGQQVNEVELLTEAEEVDATAAALVAELRQEELAPGLVSEAGTEQMTFEPEPSELEQGDLVAESELTPEVEQMLHKQDTTADGLLDASAPPAAEEDASVAFAEVTPLSDDQPAPEQAQDTSAEPTGEAVAEEMSAADLVVFSDEEWQVFREMMAGFTKPASFAQIFDSLRTLRQQQRITRSNEQLRTLVKQAINTGILERSGRGTRIYYRLAENV